MQRLFFFFSPSPNARRRRGAPSHERRERRRSRADECRIVQAPIPTRQSSDLPALTGPPPSSVALLAVPASGALPTLSPSRIEPGRPRLAWTGRGLSAAHSKQTCANNVLSTHDNHPLFTNIFTTRTCLAPTRGGSDHPVPRAGLRVRKCKWCSGDDRASTFHAPFPSSLPWFWNVVVDSIVCAQHDHNYLHSTQHEDHQRVRCVVSCGQLRWWGMLLWAPGGAPEPNAGATYTRSMLPDAPMVPGRSQ